MKNATEALRLITLFAFVFISSIVFAQDAK